jgi:hypothetical protein
MLRSLVLALAPLAISLSVSHTALATHVTCRDSFLSRIHFTGKAFGKAVSGVYAHVGALQKEWYSTPTYYWNDVQHVKMEKDWKGDFIGKAIFSGGYSSGGPSLVGAVIQYWVYFEDGTQMITDSTLINRVREIRITTGDNQPSFSEVYSYEKNALDSTTTIYETNVVKIEQCYAS